MELQFKHGQIVWIELRYMIDDYTFIKYGVCYDADFDSWLPMCSPRTYLIRRSWV
jgi:hypothetical protein